MSFYRNLSLAACLLFSALSHGAAFVEEITTPHWLGKRAHVAGTVDALFLVNDLARREPDELAQRFDLKARKVRTLRGSNAYKNVFDLDALAADLKSNPDVFVISAAKAWKDLGPQGLATTLDWVRNGGRLVVFTRSDLERELKEMSITLERPESLTEAVSTGIDLEPIFPGRFRDSFSVTQGKLGRGTITFARPFDRAYVRYNAFFPKLGSWDDPDAVRETGYLLANRIIRQAAGKSGQTSAISVETTNGKIQLSGELPAEAAQLNVQVRSASGQLLTEATAERLPTDIPVPTTGKIIVLWEQQNTECKRIGIGTTSTEMDAPQPFEVTSLASPHPRNQPVNLTWAPIAGHPEWTVEVEVYDADRNLLRFARADTKAGQLSIPTWSTRQVTHQIRAVLLGPGDSSPAKSPNVVSQTNHIRDGQKILAEHSQWLHLDAEPEADRRQWTTLTWADERDNLAERWRGHRLRELGLNATAPIGRNITGNQLASASGLRVIPTNVFVPENRYNKGRFKEEQSKDWLKEFATGVRALSPLGYSFADEPTQSVILSWLEKGRSVLEPIDPGARIGYCGVWPGSYSPELMRKSGYLGLYSPGHLYNLNIWLGLERDIYRSFRAPDGIVTIWTHYAPWADHEPYSRSVPWVWLFDGMDGVGYFKSTGMMFGILDGDLRSTHETRWWSEEIRELNAGVAEQVKRMRRDVGAVRILFGGNPKTVDPWARALNELSIPYQFLDAHHLKTEELQNVRLLIAVDGGEVSETLETFVHQGGTLIGGGGLATAQQDEGFARIFGFAPNSMTADANSDFAGIRASVKLNNIELTGLTTGECLPAAKSNGTPWQSIGGGTTVPENLQSLARSSAARSSSNGRAIYLALRPDLDSVKRWLPTLLANAKIPEPQIRLLSQDSDTPEDRVYLTRFTDDVAQLVGLVPDYHRIAPTEQLREIEANPRDSEDSRQKQQLEYFQHGPQRWQPVPARLQLGSKTHVYNIRTRQYLGTASELPISLQPGHPELFALLPYGPPKLNLKSKTAATAGTDLEFSFALQTTASTTANHVIRVELQDASGTPIPHATANQHTHEGRFTLPHYLKPGIYQLHARDILTGATAETKIAIHKPTQLASAPLPPHEFQVKRHPAHWPTGTWEPIPADNNVADTVPAIAKVKKLQRKVIHYGPHNGKEHLMTGFKIENGLRSYEMKYLVCCDPKFLNPGPPQKVRGLNGSGLGMNKPRGHLWYYNSYLKIHLGADEPEMALDYELAKIEDRSDDTTARVRLEWLTPSATVQLDYAMIPGHEGLFQQLTVRPHDEHPLTDLSVNFISYPAGFGKSGKPFFEIAQENREWLLMGDAIRDRDFYQTGNGSAGLLIRPEEWTDIKYHSRPLLKAQRSAAQAHQPWQLHWVTWMFPERGNAGAEEYMRTHSESTTRRLQQLFRNQSQ